MGLSCFCWKQAHEPDGVVLVGLKGVVVYRVICAAAAMLLIAIAAQPAIADDASVCESMKGTSNKDTNDNVIAACSRLLARNPSRASAYNGRGFAYANMGDYGRAISEFDQAIRFDPKLAAAYVNRSGTYYDFRPGPGAEARSVA